MANSRPPDPVDLNVNNGKQELLHYSRTNVSALLEHLDVLEDYARQKSDPDVHEYREVEYWARVRGAADNLEANLSARTSHIDAQAWDLDFYNNEVREWKDKVVKLEQDVARETGDMTNTQKVAVEYMEKWATKHGILKAFFERQSVQDALSITQQMADFSSLEAITKQLSADFETILARLAAYMYSFVHQQFSSANEIWLRKITKSIKRSFNERIEACMPEVESTLLIAEAYDEAETALSQAKIEIEQLKTSMQSKDNELSQLNADLTETRQKYKQTSDNLKRVQTERLAHVDPYKIKFDQLHEKHTECLEALAEARADLNKPDGSDSLREEIAKAKQAHAALVGEKNTIRQELKQATQDSTAQKEQIRKLQDDHDVIVQDRDGYRQRAEKLQEERNTRQDDLLTQAGAQLKDAGLKAQKDQFEKEIASLRTDLDGVRAEKDALAPLKTDVALLQKDIARLDKEKEELTKKNESAQSNFNASKQTVDSLRQSVQNLESELSTTKGTHQLEKTNLEERIRSLEELKGKADDLGKSRKEVVDQRVKSLQTALTDKEDKHKSATEALNTQIRALRLELEKKSTVDSLTTTQADLKANRIQLLESQLAKRGVVEQLSVAEKRQYETTITKLNETIKKLEVAQQLKSALAAEKSTAQSLNAAQTQALKDKIHHLELRVAHQAQYKELDQSQRSLYTSRITQLESDLQVEKRSHKTDRDSLSDHIERLHKAEKERDEENRRGINILDEMGQVRLSLQEYKSKSERLENDVKDYKRETQALQKSRVDQILKTNSLSTQVSNLDGKLRNAEEECSRQRNLYEDEVRTSAERLKGEEHALRQLDGAKADLVLLKSKRQEIEKAKREMQETKDGEIQRLEGQVKRLERTVDESNQLVAKMTKSNNDLQVENRQLRDAAQAGASTQVTESVRELGDQVRSLALKNAELATKERNLAQLRQEVASLNTSARRSRLAENRLMQQTKDLEKNLAAEKQRTVELDDVKEQLRDTKEKLESARFENGEITEAGRLAVRQLEQRLARKEEVRKSERASLRIHYESEQRKAVLEREGEVRREETVVRERAIELVKARHGQEVNRAKTDATARAAFDYVERERLLKASHAQAVFIAHTVADQELSKYREEAFSSMQKQLNQYSQDAKTTTSQLTKLTTATEGRLTQVQKSNYERDIRESRNNFDNLNQRYKWLQETYTKQRDNLTTALNNLQTANKGHAEELSNVRADAARACNAEKVTLRTEYDAKNQEIVSDAETCIAEARAKVAEVKHTLNKRLDSSVADTNKEHKRAERYAHQLRAIADTGLVAEIARRCVHLRGPELKALMDEISARKHDDQCILTDANCLDISGQTLVFDFRRGLVAWYNMQGMVLINEVTDVFADFTTWMGDERAFLPQCGLYFSLRADQHHFYVHVDLDGTAAQNSAIMAAYNRLRKVQKEHGRSAILRLSGTVSKASSNDRMPYYPPETIDSFVRVRPGVKEAQTDKV